MTQQKTYVNNLTKLIFFVLSITSDFQLTFDTNLDNNNATKTPNIV